MNVNSGNIQVELSSFIGKLFRDHFGKGPESIFVTVSNPFLTIYLKNFLSPLEKVLLTQKQDMTVYQTRDLIMDVIIPEMKMHLQIAAGIEIEEFYYDWDLNSKTGLILGISSQNRGLKEILPASYPRQERINEKIGLLSEESHKRPLNISSFLLNPRTLLIIREGVLTMVEKELITQGYIETLKWTKKKIERTLIKSNVYRFESDLNCRIIDIFLDWNFAQDKSVILFILQPKRHQIGAEKK